MERKKGGVIQGWLEKGVSALTLFLPCVIMCRNIQYQQFILPVTQLESLLQQCHNDQ